MMNVTNINLLPIQISGNATGTGIILSVSNGYEYDKDGKATEKIINQKYICTFPDNQYEKIVVKVSGTKPIADNEQLKKQNGLKVNFKNLTGKFYRTNSGEYALSASAESVEVCQ